MTEHENSQLKIFQELRSKVLNIDPIFFVENYLTVDGKPFNMGGAFKPFADIYRNIALNMLKEDAKPVVLLKGRQVGATTMAAALELYFMASGAFGTGGRSPMRLMHLFPTAPLGDAYVKDKLNTMMSSSKPVPGLMKPSGKLKSFIESKLDTSSPNNNSLQFKKFLNGNQIWISGAGPKGDTVRGRTVDGCFWDEFQDYTQTAIGASRKILAQSQWGPPGKGLQVYFGTPKQKGGVFYEMWHKSTQQYYFLRCQKCGELFPFYHPDFEWEKIWLYGYIVKCTHCNHEQDKRQAAANGEWKPLRTFDEEDVLYYGYHMNQLYIPKFTKETIIDEKPERNPNNSEAIYQNEVMGEFFDGEAGTITIQEIIDACGDDDKLMVSRILPEEGKKAYVGFDWGQKSNLASLGGRNKGKSYSCAVVLTADGADVFSVRFATRLTKNDPDFKHQFVEEMYNRYNISVGVGDVGDAGDLTYNLQKSLGDAFLGSRAVGQGVKNPVRLVSDTFPKEIQFDKTFYIDKLLRLMKKGSIRFPIHRYDQVGWLINHCASMDIKITFDRSGDPIKTYIKGSTPNDGFMALLNAYLAWEYEVTNGFSENNPHRIRYDKTKAEKERPMFAMGYIPNW